MSYEFITYEVDRGRARITLNRPKQRNPLSLGLLTELEDAVWNADEDEDVHCIIVAGNGPAFCAGYDLAPAPGAAKDDGVRRRSGAGSTTTSGPSSATSASCAPSSRPTSPRSPRSTATAWRAAPTSRSPATS